MSRPARTSHTPAAITLRTLTVEKIMRTLERIARYGAIAGFLFVSSGCVIAPEHEHERDRDRDSRYHDRDARDRDGREHEEHHCDDRERGDCRDRDH